MSKSETRDTTATYSRGETTVAGRVSLTLKNVSKFSAVALELLGKVRKYLAETVTKVGWIALIFVILWIPLGIALDWPEFAFLGAISSIILLVAVPFLLGGNNYLIGFELPDDHLVAGEKADAPIQITNTSNHIELPGVLEVQIGESVEEFSIPLLRAGETKDINYVVPPQKRGVLKLGPITTVRTDPVATLRRENRLKEQRLIYVHPQTKNLPPTREGILRDLEGDPTSSIVDSDMSFHSVREYVVGDNPKHIHWKLTAKLGLSGKFMLRQYEESRRSKMLVIFGLQQSEYLAGTEEFEVAVSAVGSLGLSAIRDQRKVVVLTSDEVASIARGRMKAIKEFRIQTKKRLLEDLCEINMTEQAMSVLDVCALAKAKHSDVSLAVIVVGSNFAVRDMQRVKAILPNNIGILFVVADGSSDAAPKFREIHGMKVLNIQVIADLAGLMGRFMK